jgi:SAM-dependent methyltransferase
MPNTDNYRHDSTTRIWQRPGHQGLDYSDGNAVEQRLLAAIRQSLDVSTNSAELQLNVVDWPSEYHLSPVRHNLLRPFAFGPGDHILELGCGCGAITRYLGETGATIVSVEGSYRRAEIAAERCRDLPNVSIYCDNLADFKSDEKFDYVTLIGVLEYAPLFIESDDPIGACLARALSFLKEEGALILAIENKLGLKYFAGCREDHVGIPYFGINDLYTAETPVTFGREEITRHLDRSGFGHLEFFYPFPDYKLPNLILSEQGARSERLNLRDLLIHGVGRDYQEGQHRAFAEGLAWGSLADNGLIEELSNAFLIRAYKTTQPPPKVDWLAKAYSRSHRRPEFQVESTIKPGASDTLVIRKRSFVLTTRRETVIPSFFRHIPIDSDYIDGQLLLRDIQLAVVREGSLAEISRCFEPWLSYLAAHETPEKGGKRMLPGDFIDCVPANLIVKDAGDIEYFDAEWVSENDIPMSWVLIRGITYSIIGSLSSRVLANMTYRQFIDAVLGHTLDENDYLQADAMERQFSEYCHTCKSSKVSLMDIMRQRMFLFDRLSDAPVSRQTLTAYESELARVKGTVSWRITAPLRVTWNFCHRLIGNKV